MDKSPYERRNIHCFSERQLIRFAKDYFSESNEFLRLGKSEFSLGKYDTAFKLLIIQKGLTLFIPGGGGHNSGDLGVDLRNLGN